ncbi:recombinase family protein [Gracilibacillus saliphilus]|uniref:recombinase family protein n=1 Tax=Gracilibacillus saliphilus TaxID=543890 RepID=UPI0013CFD25B|nr:recombinase family protein [Gracilibacillus saliphilus]
MRTALYIRVSTEEQLDGFSISAQKRQLTSYCESQGWDVVGFYVEEGKSAKDTNRPELQRMLKHIEDGLIDCVLVSKLDRLTRSVLDLYELLQKFEDNDCKFKSATEVYDTTSAIGRMFITLVASFAQFERERLSERVSMGMEQMAREGKWKGGAVGYGHDKINDEFVIVEEEAKVIRDMYNWYNNEGLSDRLIAIRLNERGIPTRTGAKWAENKVRRTLISKKNIGILQYGVRTNKDKSFDVEGVYPPIIDKGTYEAHLKLRDSKRLNKTKGSVQNNFYFTGITKCARCGKRLKGINNSSKKGRARKRYLCVGRSMRECDLPTVAERLIEIQFLSAFKKIIFDEGDFDLNDKNNQEDLKRYNEITKDLERVKSRRKKWQYAWAEEQISDEDFQNRMKEEKIKEEALLKELETLNLEEEKEMDNELKELLLNTADNWHTLDDGERKQLLQLIIKRIVIDIDPNEPEETRVSVEEINFN